MKNPYLTHSALITRVESLNPSVKLFTLRMEREKSVSGWWPGQFIILSIPGFGEAPFAICSVPSRWGEFQVSVQKKGALTDKIFSLVAGASVSLRGPYGNGFPLSKAKNRNILLIAGGLGLVPLRPLIQLIGRHPEEFGKIQLFSGSREARLLLFKGEYSSWQRHIDINLTLDNPSEGWKGNIGIITTIFDRVKLAKNPIVIMCGPPVMFLPVINKLKKKKIAEEDIYVMLERRMHCGIGICQHCVLVNGKYVCKDGPIFNYAEIKNSPNAI